MSDKKILVIDTSTMYSIVEQPKSFVETVLKSLNGFNDRINDSELRLQDGTLVGNVHSLPEVYKNNIYINVNGKLVEINPDLSFFQDLVENNDEVKEAIIKLETIYNKVFGTKMSSEGKEDFSSSIEEDDDLGLSIDDNIDDIIDSNTPSILSDEIDVKIDGKIKEPTNKKAGRPSKKVSKTTK